METQKKPLLQRLRPNFIWIIITVIGWYAFIAGFAHLFWELIIKSAGSKLSPAMVFILNMYAGTIVDIITLWILTYIFRQNRYIWKSFLLPRRDHGGGGPELLTDADIRAEFYGRSRNSFGMLGKGIAIGFILNFACIVAALVHGDIKLYFEAGISDALLMLFALVCVCIQSSAEELWCRGFMYERLHERYPLWFAILINGAFFGMLHVFNPGATVLSIADIVICGISFSLLRWYSGSIWIAMGVHTGWNFTQNFLFGLPNSGLVSEVSLFHLDASTGQSNLIYDYAFGVEGAVPAVLADLLLGVICLVLAYKAGRLQELRLNYTRTQEKLGVNLVAAEDAESVSAAQVDETVDTAGVIELADTVQDNTADD